VCRGQCRVTCTNVQTCSIQCSGGSAPISCPGGDMACGSC
jgi:hypothetical protein